MTKRKSNDYKNVFEPILANKYVLYDYYNNQTNGDKLVLMDNHICFNSLINYYFPLQTINLYSY